MTTDANKFLRIYYGRVREYLTSWPKRKKTKDNINSFIRPAFFGGLIFVLFIQPV